MLRMLRGRFFLLLVILLILCAIIVGSIVYLGQVKAPATVMVHHMLEAPHNASAARNGVTLPDVVPGKP